MSVTPIGPRLADLILMTDLRRGIVRTLSLTQLCCCQAHTFPHVTADSRVMLLILLSRIGIVHVSGDPPNQVVLPLSVIALRIGGTPRSAMEPLGPSW